MFVMLRFPYSAPVASILENRTWVVVVQEAQYPYGLWLNRVVFDSGPLLPGPGSYSFLADEKCLKN
jgi:hypothetical protein